MAFIDQGEFEAMKTLSGRRDPCRDKHQFCAKMTVQPSYPLFMQIRPLAMAILVTYQHFEMVPISRLLPTTPTDSANL